MIRWLRDLRYGPVDRFIWRHPQALLWAARLWRRLLSRTTFIAVTGSVGKTTAKELMVAALRTRGRVSATRGSANAPLHIAFTLLRVRPWHRFAVVEIATGEPGQVAAGSRMVRPHVAVILTVARTHTQRVGTLEDIAAEKAGLFEGLVRGGTAVLNADDVRVAAMRPPGKAPVVRFGTSEGCHVRVRSTASAWPERLKLEADVAGTAVTCDTRLVGTHWWPSIAAALAVASTCGVSAEAAAAAMGSVGPTTGRLSPVRTPTGAVLLRDDFNGSVDTLERAIDVMRAARAARRCLVLSDYSDLGESFRGRFRLLPELLGDVFDTVVLVGKHAAYGKRRLLEAGVDAERVDAVETLREASALLAERFGPGDLVLLRGQSSDHVARLAVAQFGDISCWKMHCGLMRLCDECRMLGADEATLQAAARDVAEG